MAVVISTVSAGLEAPSFELKTKLVAPLPHAPALTNRTAKLTASSGATFEAFHIICQGLTGEDHLRPIGSRERDR